MPEQGHRAQPAFAKLVHCGLWCVPVEEPLERDSELLGRFQSAAPECLRGLHEVLRGVVDGAPCAELGRFRAGRVDVPAQHLRRWHTPPPRRQCWLRFRHGELRVPIQRSTCEGQPTRGDEQSRVAALEAGATLYLTKPFQPQAIAAEVARLMQAASWLVVQRAVRVSHVRGPLASWRLTDRTQGCSVALLGALIALGLLVCGGIMEWLVEWNR